MAEGKENKPLHVLAEEAIKKMIRLPEYQNGKLLPNEIELARNLNISRNTLRQAINKMVFEGLLCRRKGYGTWVAKKTITGGVKNWLSFSQEMQRLGITIKNYELHVSLEYPDEKVRRFFGLDEEGKAGTLCLKLERVRGHAEYPFVVFISYFNPRFPISSDDNFTMPLYELLETKYNIVVHTSVEEISARLAGKRISEVNRMAELGVQLAHVDGDVPNLRIEIPQIDAESVGALLYFFERACGISGYLLGVNPFDQPGVEAYKKNMFALLGKPGYEEMTAALKSRL